LQPWICVPLQRPFVQLSPVVQAFASLQPVPGGAFVKTQPSTSSQLPIWQGLLPTSQSRGGPAGWQDPLLQRSFWVQGSPSLQTSSLSTWSQLPSRSLHWSVVQALPSLQSRGAPDRQIPPLQTSPTLQGLASSQGSVLFVWPQPRVGWQVADVQSFTSSGQTRGAPAQVPFVQLSPVVQIEPSEQVVPFATAGKTQPVAGLQASVVQAFPSLQGSGLVPGRQLPPEQRSPLVQAFPSLQGRLLPV
jgi:hypothetical protein